MIDGDAQNEQQAAVPAEQRELPLLPLLHMVVFPLTIAPLAVSQPESLMLINHALRDAEHVGLVAIKSLGQRPDPLLPEHFYQLGTIAMVHKLVRLPDGTLRVALQGLARMQIREILSQSPYYRVRVDLLPEPADPPAASAATALAAVVELLRQIVGLMPQVPDELRQALAAGEPLQLVYQAATSIPMRLDERQRILSLPSLQEKLLVLGEILGRHLLVLQIGQQLRQRQ